MENKEALHAVVESLNITRFNTAVAIHALIDLGSITKIECSMPECKYESRAFTSYLESPKLSITLDHIEERVIGGSNRPENIRLLHMGCNSIQRLKFDCRCGRTVSRSNAKKHMAFCKS